MCYFYMLNKSGNCLGITNLVDIVFMEPRTVWHKGATYPGQLNELNDLKECVM